jgi:hypothetical protein
LNGHRPDNRNVSRLAGTARPSGANIDVLEIDTSPRSNCRATSGSSHAKNSVELPIMVVHPVEPSASASRSMAVTTVVRSASSPPSDAGTSN